MKLYEVRKEDDSYFQGAFWIEGESVRDIKKGNFKIIGIRLDCDYNGNYIGSLNRSKSSLTHKRLWNDYNDNYKDKPYNYLPRGRVAIYNGIAFIHINSLFNQPSIIDAIIKMYNISKLEIEIDCNDIYQGSHYEFLLK